MNNYVIGDIQGCYKPLRKLLKKVRFSPNRDKLWCVGDLVNRGPNSLDTLRFLQDIDDATHIVLGNHDLHFIAINEGCAPSVSAGTLSRLLDARDCQDLSDWLRSKRLAYYQSLDTRNGIRNFLMIHAGVSPLWSLQKTLNLAAEVEYALQSSAYRDHLRHMYGNTPTFWYNKLRGLDRLRVITNYLTRIRFCDEIGTLKLTVKEGLEAAPHGFKPWYEYEKITPKAALLFGHWAAIEGRTGRKQVHALDTGCVWGRDLTLMRLEDKQRYRVSG
ncbi:MAG: diadenosine tetraphosphatase [Gammaproteobacteria bacterium]|nr:diadenosine tetraphosphatase [Gammaproteobacteria bacterium]